MSPTAPIRDGVLRGVPALCSRLLLVVAAAVSGYLLAHALSGGSVVGCAPGSSCDTVLNSRWAFVLGVPVSALALVLDLALLLSTFACGPRSNPAQRRKAWELMLPGAVLLLGAALWFVALQAFVLHAFCKFCLTAHGAGSVAAVLLLLRLPVTDRVDKREKSPAVLRGAAVKLATAAIALVALFAVAQVAVAPRSYSVKTVPVASSETNAPAQPTNAVAASTSKTNAPAPAVSEPKPVEMKPVVSAPSPSPALFDVYAGLVKLDLARIPLWGNPAAPQKLVSLYDYTCHHCAMMHPRVVAVKKAFGDKLAVISLPMPLDGTCNTNVIRTPKPHRDACSFARLGLAVWQAKPEAQAAFDDWLFEEVLKNYEVRHVSQPPPLTEATNKAAQLVGGLPVLEKALRDPAVEQNLAASLAIYNFSYRELKNGSMPQFIIGSNLISGMLEVPQLQELVGKYVFGK